MTPKAIIMTIGAIAGSLVGIWALWIQLGGAVPASQMYVMDIIRPILIMGKKQTRESARIGAELYRQKTRGLLILPPPENLEQRQIWREMLDESRRQQKYFEDKEIELRK